MARFFLTLIFLFGLMGTSYGQNGQKVPSFSMQMNFVPESFDENPDQHFELSITLPQSSRSSSLWVTGFLLHGLKYSSPIDEFFSYEPFDARAINPLSFTDYSSYITAYYSIQQSHLPVYGW